MMSTEFSLEKIGLSQANWRRAKTTRALFLTLAANLAQLGGKVPGTGRIAGRQSSAVVADDGEISRHAYITGYKHFFEP